MTSKTWIINTVQKFQEYFSREMILLIGLIGSVCPNQIRSKIKFGHTEFRCLKRLGIHGMHTVGIVGSSCGPCHHTRCQGNDGHRQEINQIAKDLRINFTSLSLYARHVTTSTNTNWIWKIHSRSLDYDWLAWKVMIFFMISVPVIFKGKKQRQENTSCFLTQHDHI